MRVDRGATAAMCFRTDQDSGLDCAEVIPKPKTLYIYVYVLMILI